MLIEPIPQNIKPSYQLFFLTEIQLIYNVVLVSHIQQYDSVLHIYLQIFIFFPIKVYYGILSSLCYIYSRTLLSVYFINSNLYLLAPNSCFIHSPPPFPFANHKPVFYILSSLPDALCIFLHYLSYLSILLNLHCYNPTLFAMPAAYCDLGFYHYALKSI